MVTPSDEHRFFHVMIRVALVAVSLGTVLALFSHQHWVAELFSHFRLYYLLAQALLMLIFLHTRHRVLLALTLLLSIPNALSVVPYLTPLVVGRSAAALPEEQVSIIAMNVDYNSSDYESMLNYLASNPADVIVVSEYTPARRGSQPSRFLIPPILTELEQAGLIHGGWSCSRRYHSSVRNCSISV